MSRLEIGSHIKGKRYEMEESTLLMNTSIKLLLDQQSSYSYDCMKIFFEALLRRTNYFTPLLIFALRSFQMKIDPNTKFQRIRNVRKRLSFLVFDCIHPENIIATHMVKDSEIKFNFC